MLLYLCIEYCQQRLDDQSGSISIHTNKRIYDVGGNDDDKDQAAVYISWEVFVHDG